MTKPDSGKDPNLTTLSFGIIATSGPLPILPEAPPSKKTGKELERAVSFIQETILKSDPKLKGAEFTIESRKIAEVSGVHHEVDVLVKTLPNTDYQSASIFECKDWKDPVGKNDVIVLGEKVRALAANRGFMVAREITKDAQSQINLDPRLAFVPVTDTFLSPFNHLQIVHASYDLLPIRIKTKERGVPTRENPDTLDWQTSKCSSNGQPITFLDFLKPIVDYLVLQKREESASRLRQIGTHFEKRAQIVHFTPAEFSINGVDLEYMAIEVQFFVTVARKKLFSKFELKDRGRCFSFAPIENVLFGKSIQIDLVECL